MWVELVREFGLSTFSAALKRLMERSQFFPHPSEIRKTLEAERAQQDQREREDRRKREWAEIRRKCAEEESADTGIPVDRILRWMRENLSRAERIERWKQGREAGEGGRVKSLGTSHR
jgi:hypothetical protein